MLGTESLKRIIDQICRDKGIGRDLLIDAIEEAVRSAVRKKYGNRREIEVQFNEELGEVEVFWYRTVVDEVLDPETEILLEDAKKLDTEVELEDDLGEKIENIAELGRIAAQSAKQVIIHRMRDAERDVIYEMFRDRQGTVVNGIVQRFERGDMIVNLGRTDALLPRDGQIPKRAYKQGDRIRAYLQEVRRETREGKHRDAQLILNRTCNEFLIKLFEMEVPEVAEGIVKIMAASREPGFRAKIAVSSIESDVDPVGACVGMKGSRVQNVVQELQGERIDIVPWSPDPVRYVCNALAPAEVKLVIADDERKALLAVVPDDQLSLAIGRQGQNVRLASRLLGWRIDVKSEHRYHNIENPEYRAMLTLEGVDEPLVDRLFAASINSLALLAATEIPALIAAAKVDAAAAEALQVQARARVGEVEAETVPVVATPEQVTDEATPEQVTDVATPEQVTDVATPEQVTDVATPEQVTDEATPEQVTDVATPEQVTDEATPEQVTDEATPEQVTDVATPEQVTDVATPEQVTDEATPEQVTDEATPEQVTDEAVGEGGQETGAEEQEKSATD